MLTQYLKNNKIVILEEEIIVIADRRVIKIKLIIY